MTRASLVLLLFATLAPCQDVLWRREGIEDQESRGRVLWRLGDVNGDGFEDLMEYVRVRVSPGQWCCWESEIWVTSGRDGSRLSAYRQPPNIAWQEFAVLGDIDRDGVPDYGYSWFDTRPISNPPSGFDIRSGANHSLIRQVNLFAEPACGNVDLNGDGRTDYVLNAYRTSPGGTVIAYDNSGVELYRIVDPRPDLLIGLSLAPLGGDFDRDGCDDFLVACAEINDRGAIVLVSGRTGALLRTSYGEIPGDKLDTVVGCGDLDGDGVLDYAGGGSAFGNFVVRTFSGATGQAIHTWRGSLGVRLKGGFDVDQDGVTDLVTSTNLLLGYIIEVHSGRTGTPLYRFLPSHPFRSIAADNGMFLAAPPGEQYPLIVYSEPDWNPPNGTSVVTPGLLWAVRGSPPTVRAFGQGTAIGRRRLPPRLGMYDLPGPQVRFTLSQAPPSVPALLLLGCSDQTIAGRPLPLGLGPFGLPGISLLTSSEVALLAVTGSNGAAAGYARLDLRLTLTATGTPLFAQWCWLDPANLRQQGSTAAHRMLAR